MTEPRQSVKQGLQSSAKSTSGNGNGGLAIPQGGTATFPTKPIQSILSKKNSGELETSAGHTFASAATYAFRLSRNRVFQ